MFPLEFLPAPVVQSTGSTSLKRKAAQLDDVAQAEKRQRKAEKKRRKNERKHARLARMASQQPSNMQLQAANPMEFVDLSSLQPNLSASWNSNHTIFPSQWSPVINQFWNTVGGGMVPGGQFPSQVAPFFRQFGPVTPENKLSPNWNVEASIPATLSMPPPSYSEATLFPVTPTLKWDKLYRQIDKDGHIQQDVLSFSNPGHSPDLVTEEGSTTIAAKQHLLDCFILKHKADLLKLTAGGMTKEQKVAKMKDMTERSKNITQLTNEIKAYFEHKTPRATPESTIFQPLPDTTFTHQWPQTDYPVVIILDDD